MQSRREAKALLMDWVRLLSFLLLPVGSLPPPPLPGAEDLFSLLIIIRPEGRFRSAMELPKRDNPGLDAPGCANEGLVRRCDGLSRIMEEVEEGSIWLQPEYWEKE